MTNQSNQHGIPAVGVSNVGFYRINGTEGDGALPAGTVLYAAPVPAMIEALESLLEAFDLAAANCTDRVNFDHDPRPANARALLARIKPTK